jgi:hypothetical protein
MEGTPKKQAEHTFPELQHAAQRLLQRRRRRILRTSKQASKQESNANKVG